MLKIAIVYFSGYGHTKELIPHAKKAIEEEGLFAEAFNVEELSAELRELSGFSGIFFLSPTYMSDVPAQMKKFMDKTSAIWFARSWKGVVAAAAVNSGSAAGSKEHTLNTFFTFAASHGMIWVPQSYLPTNFEDQSLLFDPQQDLNRFGYYTGSVTLSINQPAGPNNPPFADRQTVYLHVRDFAKVTKKLHS